MDAYASDPSAVVEEPGSEKSISSANGLLKGQVISLSTGEPLALAKITPNDSDNTITANGQGEFEIEYENETLIYQTGDGVFIPEGKEHKHKARVLSEIVRVIFVENA